MGHPPLVLKSRWTAATGFSMVRPTGRIGATAARLARVAILAAVLAGLEAICIFDSCLLNLQKKRTDLGARVWEIDYSSWVCPRVFQACHSALLQHAFPSVDRATNDSLHG